MSLINLLRVGDRVKFRRQAGLPDRRGCLSFTEHWGRVMIVNRGASVVLDAGGKHGRPVVLTHDAAVLEAKRDGKSLIRAG